MSDPVDPARLASFVSPHGFGHAARCSAVMAAAHRQGGVHFDLFTTAPRWFFDESIARIFRYHEAVVDVGFRQHSALEVDLPATIAALLDHVPLDEGLIDELADRVRSAGCVGVLCDIAPLGIAVAEKAGLPSVLVENFSWPWLYEPYISDRPELEAIGVELDRWSERATVHVQARPVCHRQSGLELVDPISREPRLERADARRALGVEGDGPVVVLTMGGYGEEFPFLDRLRDVRDTTFVVTGMPATSIDGNLLMFDNTTPLFMPDVLRAADAVVAKLGYGTVAEVWREGLPFGHVTRRDFREMPPLERFAADEMSGFLIEGDAFASGYWVDRIPELLAKPRRPHSMGGASRVAEILLDVSGLADPSVPTEP
ncbi:MAG: hypothetical protein O2958_03545 [Gemmatimonadetes bacterium]|nr:hypothetical protein [Gemmatimonadota bacterium]MDA1102395.1 hypothetical protein [Gemmatimonadota bacterium]